MGSAADRATAMAEFKPAWKALKARTPPEQLAAAYRAMNLPADLSQRPSARAVRFGLSLIIPPLQGQTGFTKISWKCHLFRSKASPMCDRPKPDPIRIRRSRRGEAAMPRLIRTKVDRKVSDKRTFPAIDISRSGTRKEELITDPQLLKNHTRKGVGFSLDCFRRAVSRRPVSS
jgi:hypothetical protein